MLARDIDFSCQWWRTENDRLHPRGCHTLWICMYSCYFCIWCGLHQLDLKLQLFYKELLIVEDDDAHENERGFYPTLTGLIAYLWQQQTLITEMKTTCRTLANTCWESMSKVSSWFKEHSVRIQLHSVEKIPFVHPLLNGGLWFCSLTLCHLLPL